MQGTHKSQLEAVDHLFINAVYSGNLEEFQRLRKEYPEVNLKGIIGIRNLNLLHIAVLGDQPRMVEALLDAAPSLINGQTEAGRTPLHAAVECNRDECAVQLLKSNQIQLRLCNALGETALHSALKKKQIFQAKEILNHIEFFWEVPQDQEEKEGYMLELLSSKSQVQTIDLSAKRKDARATFKKSDRHKETLLHVAANLNDVDLVGQIVRLNDRLLNQCNIQGRTPLHLAVFHENARVVKFLLNQPHVKTQVHDQHGWLPFHSAILKGNLEIAEWLVKKEGRWTDSTTIHGYNPLHILAVNDLFQRPYEVGVALIQNLFSKSQIDPNSFSQQGLSPLHYAARLGNVDFMRDLMGADALRPRETGVKSLKSWFTGDSHVNLNIKDFKGNTPLHLAVLFGHLNCVEFLMQQPQIEADAKNNVGETPALLAVRSNRINLVEYFWNLDEESIESTNYFEETALHIAAAKGHKKLLEKLIGTGQFDINAKDGMHRSALHLLLKQWHRACVRLRKEPVKNKETPSKLYQTVTHRYPACVKLLLKEGISITEKDLKGFTPAEYARKKGFLDAAKRMEAHLVHSKAQLPKGRP